jgi:hypothetical protein
MVGALKPLGFQTLLGLSPQIPLDFLVVLTTGSKVSKAHRDSPAFWFVDYTTHPMGIKFSVLSSFRSEF